MDDGARTIKSVNDALQSVPMHERLAALACAIVSDEPRATEAICDFVAVAGMMTRQLSPAQRLRVAWAMLEELEAIGARWN